MSVYLIGELEITDPDTFRRYQEAVPELIAAHGGRYLVRGGAAQVLEGDWDPQRLVVLEFPNRDAAHAFWDGDDYARIAPWRREASVSKVVLVEGVGS